MSRNAVVTVVLLILLATLVVLCTLLGSVDIPASAIWNALSGGSSGNEAWDIIVLESRVPMIVTAALAGAALAVAGLLLQTTFSNPLAGPSILGVSAGAGLGVAVVMLAVGGSAASAFTQELGGYFATLDGERFSAQPQCWQC